MTTNARHSCLAASLILSVGLWGCTSSEEARRSPAPAPPPPPEESQMQRTYDYPHTVERTGQQGLRRKLVVALVRSRMYRSAPSPRMSNPWARPPRLS